MMDKTIQQAVIDLQEYATNLSLLFEGIKDLPVLVDEVNDKIGRINSSNSLYRVQATITTINRLLFYSIVDLNQIQSKIFDIALAFEELEEDK